MSFGALDVNSIVAVVIITPIDNFDYRQQFELHVAASVIDHQMVTTLQFYYLIAFFFQVEHDWGTQYVDCIMMGILSTKR